MDAIDFYNDKKWCSSCRSYVPYLMSIEHSYCAECGTEVRLFSKEDWKAFSAGMDERRPKAGRGKKAKGADEGRESA